MSDGAANANCNSDTQQQQQQEQQQHQQLHTKPVWQSTMKIGNSTASLQSHLHSPSTPEIEGMHSAKKKKKSDLRMHPALAACGICLWANQHICQKKQQIQLGSAASFRRMYTTPSMYVLAIALNAQQHPAKRMGSRDT
jgi:hypothetical protein